MKLLVQLSLCCLLATSAFGQHRGMGGGFGRGGFGGGFRGGFVGGGFRGGFVRGGFGGGFGHRGFFAPGFGFRDPRFFRFGFRHPFFFSRFGFFGFHRGFFSPFGFPAFAGGFAPIFSGFDPAFGVDPPYPAQPNVTVVYPYAAEPSPPVVVTQYTRPARAVTREYNRPEDYGQAETPYKQTIYLIAFKDHVIRAALAYWADGDVLHYVGMDHAQKQAPLSSIDREFSEQLNRERHVPFRLPPEP